MRWNGDWHEIKKQQHMKIGLVAHDNRKEDLIQWVEFNSASLAKHELICTGTTGKMVTEALNKKDALSINVKRLKSGPLGGDQELGSMIANNQIDILIFLWDPMSMQPHDVDVKALLRLAVLYNIPTANNRATADFIISSDLFGGDYHRIEKDYSEYIGRKI
jgi:methylglyoxal synthase